MQQCYSCTHFEQESWQIACLRIAERREPRSWYTCSASEPTAAPCASQHRRSNPRKQAYAVFTLVYHQILLALCAPGHREGTSSSAVTVAKGLDVPVYNNGRCRCQSRTRSRTPLN